MSKLNQQMAQFTSEKEKFTIKVQLEARLMLQRVVDKNGYKPSDEVEQYRQQQYIYERMNNDGNSKSKPDNNHVR